MKETKLVSELDLMPFANSETLAVNSLNLNMEKDL